MVASDPHIAFAAVSCWYEVQLTGGSFDVAGMAYVGMPTVMFGRNRRVAWGITNNICSQRDLYHERTDPHRPGGFLYDGEWEPERTLVETIKVRGTDSIHKTIRFSRNGPIVDEILPLEAEGTGPVSLRWLGHTYCGWLTSLLGIDRAKSVAEFREATRTWRVPTWSLVIADVEGHVGYQAVGGIPVRTLWARGYRPGWDPAHQWQGLIPFEQMPRLEDPECGWIASANIRVAPDDFPYPLSGTWASGHRARRIRQMIEERDRFTRETFAAMHQDTRTLRADAAKPGLLPVLRKSGDARVLEAARYLESWDHNMTPDSAAASIFEVFFNAWCRRVASERFDEELAASLSGSCGGLAGALIHADTVNWFNGSDREAAIVEALRAALTELEGRLGQDMSALDLGRTAQGTATPCPIQSWRTGPTAGSRRPAGGRQWRNRLQYRIRSQLGGVDGRQLSAHQRSGRGWHVGGRVPGSVRAPRIGALLRPVGRVACRSLSLPGLRRGQSRRRCGIGLHA